MSNAYLIGDASKEGGGSVSFEAASVREQLRRVAKTVDDFQDHRKRLSRFELVECVNDLGLHT